MKNDTIEEFAKQKKREHRMKMDKLKNSAKQHIHEKQCREMNKYQEDKYLCNDRYCSG